MARSKQPQKKVPEPTEEPEEQELSLDALSAAFAEAQQRPPGAMGAVEAAGLKSSPATSAAESSGEIEEPIREADALASAPGDDACPISPLTILEALLFVGDPSGQPIPVERLAGVMRGV